MNEILTPALGTIRWEDETKIFDFVKLNKGNF
jgi:hypothetical protein